jgi:hypothetical protein
MDKIESLMDLQAYLKFLVISDGIWSGISNNGRRIIEAVAKQGDETPYRVQDIIAMKDIA